VSLGEVVALAWWLVPAFWILHVLVITGVDLVNWWGRHHRGAL
jgi:hypothetical protein